MRIMDVEIIKKVFKADTKPVVAEELPQKAMCIPLTVEITEFLQAAYAVMDEIIQENDKNE